MRNDTARVLRSAALIISANGDVARSALQDEWGHVDAIGAIRVAAGLPAQPFKESAGQAYGPEAKLSHEALCALVRSFTPGFGNRLCDTPTPGSWGLPPVAVAEREAGRWSDTRSKDEIVAGLNAAAGNGKERS